MRLIDADVLMKEIEQSKNHNTHKDLARKLNHDSEHLHFMRMVSNQPTAFDKEKVIMSKVEIEIPDDKWIHVSSGIVPKDKQLCVVIPKNEEFIGIYQYRKPEKYFNQSRFVDVSTEIIYRYLGSNSYPEHIFYEDVGLWKPLGLPADINERILAEIENWF